MRGDVPIVRNFTDTPGFRRQQGKEGCILGQEENQRDTLFMFRMLCLGLHMHLHGA